MIREKIKDKFENKLFALNKNDPMYEARVMYLEREKEEGPDAVNSFEKNAKLKKESFKLLKKKFLLVQIQEGLK